MHIDMSLFYTIPFEVKPLIHYFEFHFCNFYFICLTRSVQTLFKWDFHTSFIAFDPFLRSQHSFQKRKMKSVWNVLFCSSFLQTVAMTNEFFFLSQSLLWPWKCVSHQCKIKFLKSFIKRRKKIHRSKSIQENNHLLCFKVQPGIVTFYSVSCPSQNVCWRRGQNTNSYLRIHCFYFQFTINSEFTILLHQWHLAAPDCRENNNNIVYKYLFNMWHVSCIMWLSIYVLIISLFPV